VSKLINLINAELNKIFKFILPTVIAYIVIQAIYSFMVCNNLINSINNIAKRNNISFDEAVNTMKENSFRSIQNFINNSEALVIGFAIILALIGVYMLGIWYREWFGNNKTIYTLLMLPMNRMNIYFSKFISIITLVGIGISSLIVSFLIDYKIYISMIPEKLATKNALQAGMRDTFMQMIPIDLRELVVYILVVLAFVSIVFQFILLERSYKKKGFVLGLVLGGAYLAINIVILATIYLFQLEKLMLIGLFNGIVIAATTYLSNYLVKNRVTV
jgi:hypothetical protein